MKIPKGKHQSKARPWSILPELAGCPYLSARRYAGLLQPGAGGCEGCIHQPDCKESWRAASRIHCWLGQPAKTSTDSEQIPPPQGNALAFCTVLSARILLCNETLQGNAVACRQPPTCQRCNESLWKTAISLWETAVLVANSVTIILGHGLYTRQRSLCSYWASPFCLCTGTKFQRQCTDSAQKAAGGGRAGNPAGLCRPQAS